MIPKQYQKVFLNFYKNNSTRKTATQANAETLIRLPPFHAMRIAAAKPTRADTKLSVALKWLEMSLRIMLRMARNTGKSEYRYF